MSSVSYYELRQHSKHYACVLQECGVRLVNVLADSLVLPAFSNITRIGALDRTDEALAARQG